MQVAVLGTGAVGCAVAADLAHGGHRVRLWARSEPDLAALRDAKGPTLVGERRERKAQLAAITADLREAVSGAEVVVAAGPATDHEDLGKRLAHHLEPAQVVLLTAGLFGAWALAREITRAGGTMPQAVAETAVPPHLARRRSAAEVAVAARAVALPVGVLPAARADAALARLAELFPAATPCTDALDAALLNPWVAIRAPLVLLNAGGAERERFEVELASSSPLLRLVEAVDGERVAARRGLRYPAPHHERPKGGEVGPPTALYGPDAAERLAKSGLETEMVDLDHPWVREEGVLGLSLLESAARTAGVESLAITGLLAVLGALLGQPLSGRGRALEALGLGDLLWREIRALLREGWTSPVWRRIVA